MDDDEFQGLTGKLIPVFAVITGLFAAGLLVALTFGLIWLAKVVF